MKNLRIESSVREAKKVEHALRDTFLNGSFNQIASNVWELPEYDEDENGEYPGDEFATEQLENFKFEIEEVFKSYGIDENEVEISII